MVRYIAAWMLVLTGTASALTPSIERISAPFDRCVSVIHEQEIKHNLTANRVVINEKFKIARIVLRDELLIVSCDGYRREIALVRRPI